MLYKKRMPLFLLIVILIVTVMLSACQSEKEIYVTWTNADGSLIGYEQHLESYNPATRELPPDTDEWHYTGWSVLQNGNSIVCSAVRVPKFKVEWISEDGNVIDSKKLPLNEIDSSLVSLPKDTDDWHYQGWDKQTTSDGVRFTVQCVAKKHYIWKDADGTVLFEQTIIDGKEPTEQTLPDGDIKWLYTEWSSEKLDNQIIYTAQKIPNRDYFVGNVFQIIMKDKDGKAISSGSGFVINEDGWFITNNHVMKEGYSATAFFDIKDAEKGDRYTQLSVLGGVYNSEDKDIFIGKLDGYSKIKQYYQNIVFTEEYSAGEMSYTIGYPNSSIEMEINSGVILKEYSDIYDKINGVYYILSDSYIAPGSSGGILTNEKFEVIGITTIGLYADSNKLVYEAGGSVPTFVFSSHLKELNESKLKPLREIYK